MPPMRASGGAPGPTQAGVRLVRASVAAVTPEESRRLYGLAVRFARRHPAMASHVDDLHQVAMLAVWRADATGSLATVVARRQMIDYARGVFGREGSARRQVRTRSLDALQDPAEDRPAWEPSAADDPEGTVCDRDTAARALAAMTVKQRTVVLATGAGWTLREVGEAMGTSESCACQLRRHARAKVA